MTTKNIRRRRERPPRDTDEILADAKRMVLGFAKRAAQSDPEHFGQYRDLIMIFRQGEDIIVTGLRGQGHSDEDIATGGKMSRRNVRKRWPRR